MQTAEQELDDALGRIIARGWHQGDYVGPGGSVCLMGALMDAQLDRCCCGVEGCTATSWTGHHTPSEAALRFVLDVLHDQYGKLGNDIPHYNDRVLVEQADAETVLEKARTRAAEVGI